MSAAALTAAGCGMPPPTAELIGDALANNPPVDDDMVFVAVGDSITRGTIGHSWINDVAVGLGPEWTVINAGVNGALSYGVNRRLDEVADCRPDVVSVLIGTNDIMADVDPVLSDRAVANYDLPAPPSLSSYREQLEDTVDALRSTTDAEVLLLSMPAVGENPADDVWPLTTRYAGVVAEVADVYGVHYAPLFEDMRDALEVLPARETPALSTWRGLMEEGDVLHEQGLSWSDIGDRSGFHLHSDHLHLDEDGARMVTRLVLDAVHDLR